MPLVLLAVMDPQVLKVFRVLRVVKVLQVLLVLKVLVLKVIRCSVPGVQVLRDLPLV